MTRFFRKLFGSKASASSAETKAAGMVAETIGGVIERSPRATAMATLNESQRAELLAAHAETSRHLNELDAQMLDEGETDESVCRVNELADRIKWLENLYRQSLQAVPLSRCPFTGQVAAHSFDAAGLDGLWWRYHHPVRPQREPMAGPHFVGLTGAVRLAPPPETTPFLVVPGPDAPYVVPRVLRLPQVHAVISQLGIGRHRAAAITYFANAPLGEVRSPTLWGTGWNTMDIGARTEDDEISDDEEDFDFELAPWVRSGKLHWIAPNDTNLLLRSGLEGCPYLQVPGERKIQRLQFGQCWTDYLHEQL